MRDRAGIATVVITMFLPLSCSKLGTARVAVDVGGDDGLDACQSWAVPRPSGVAGGTFVEVRDGPGHQFPVVDRLGSGRTIIVCDEAGDGDWSGIVYPEDGTDAGTCGVSSPIAERQPYRGPCRSGWLRSDAVEIVAG